MYDPIDGILSLDFNAERNVYKKIRIGEKLTNFCDLTGQYAKSLLFTGEMLKLAGNADCTHFVKLVYQRIKGALLSKLHRLTDAI